MGVSRRGDVLGHNFPSEGVHSTLDLVITSPYNSTGQLRGPVDALPGHVAEQAAAEKRASYQNLEAPFVFVPVSYETFGRACEQTCQFLETAATAAAKSRLGFDAVEGSDIFARTKNYFLGRWSKMISICLQKSVANQIVFGWAQATGRGPAGFLDYDYVDIPVVST